MVAVDRPRPIGIAQANEGLDEIGGRDMERTNLGAARDGQCAFKMLSGFAGPAGSEFEEAERVLRVRSERAETKRGRNLDGFCCMRPTRGLATEHRFDGRYHREAVTDLPALAGLAREISCLGHRDVRVTPSPGL